jgi:hypothetical protein
MNTNARNIYIICDGKTGFLSVLVVAAITLETGENTTVVLA